MDGGQSLPRRQRLALLVAIACALLSTGGLAASFLVKSPQQALADTAAPPASELTAPVERRVLASTMVTRGTVTAATSLEVTPVALAAGAQVVTAVQIKVGDELHAGQVLLAVSARPLIVLPGAQPAYRDLKPGDSGTDVSQLQAALRRLGYRTAGERAGYFGPRTKAAVRALYADRGYDAADTGGPGGRGDRTALSAATKQVNMAADAVTAMRRRIAAGETAGPDELALPEQLTRLNQALDAARRDRADLVATTGTMLPLAEFVFVPRFPARVAAFAARVGDKVVAPLVTVSTGDLTVRVKLRPEQAGLVRADMPVTVAAEALGETADGSVTEVGAVTTDADTSPGGEQTTGAPYRPLTIAMSKPLPARWAGLDVRVTITSARTEGPVLVVPLSALSAGADGRTFVSVRRSDGGLDQVQVRPGVSGDGYVEVAPLQGGLDEHDRVLIGAAP
jgi:HlyD family secretion protein